MSGTQPRSGLHYAAAGFFGSLTLRLLGATWRIDERPRRHMRERQEARQGGTGTVYLQWHSRILTSAVTQRGTGLHVMVSQSDDGEYIARAIHGLGMNTIRGSTSRGAARALIEAIRALKQGKDVGITPDGPRGPRFVLQAGCVVAASKSGAPIVPVGADAARAKRFRSWDRFMLPAPFTKVAVRFGEPITVPPGLDEAALEEWRLRVEEALLAVTADAAVAVGKPAEVPGVDPLQPAGG